jgi:hypothetical protein
MKTKEQTKWTAGPWVDDGHDGKDTQIVNSKWGEIARVVYNGDVSQRAANARLIAAAPDLLAACEKILSDPYTTCCCADIVRTAIAKARGDE